MAHYAGLDVSDKETAIHVVDGSGKTVWRGKRPSEPDALASALRRHAPELERVGLELQAGVREGRRDSPLVAHVELGLHGEELICQHISSKHE